MAHAKVNYHDVDPMADGMHFLRDELGCEKVGFTVVEADPDWTGKEHDHAEKAHEEVYFLVEGQATVVLEDEEVSLSPGDALRVSGDESRQIQNGPVESTFVVAGAS
jgi:mannose-6-phosphate isomerase-like protein (cupin superfamily)